MLSNCAFSKYHEDSKGCKDGVTWCNDPRCYPYCADCINDSVYNDRYYVYLGLIIGFILSILFISLITVSHSR